MPFIYNENQQFNLLIILLKKICKKNPYILVCLGNSVYFCKTIKKLIFYEILNSTTSNL